MPSNATFTCFNTTVNDSSSFTFKRNHFEHSFDILNHLVHFVYFLFEKVKINLSAMAMKKTNCWIVTDYYVEVFRNLVEKKKKEDKLTHGKITGRTISLRNNLNSLIKARSTRQAGQYSSSILEVCSETGLSPLEAIDFSSHTPAIDHESRARNLFNSISEVHEKLIIDLPAEWQVVILRIFEKKRGRISPLKTQITSTEDESNSNDLHQIFKNWKVQGQTWYSAPSAVFLAGEHSVVFGHPAVYLPLPLRVHTLVYHSVSTNQVNFQFFSPNPSDPKQILPISEQVSYERKVNPEHIARVNDLFDQVIRPLLLPHEGTADYGFHIEVCSEVPLACGMNTSGAISAGIAQALVEHYINLELLAKRLNRRAIDRQSAIFFLGWLIENCFHNFRASGAGVAAALHGRRGRHPIIYFTERRSLLTHRIKNGWSSLNLLLGDDVPILEQLQYCLIDASAPIDSLPEYETPPEYNLTVLYSGTPSKTGDILKYQQIREFRDKSESQVRQIQQRVSTIIGQERLHRPLAIHSRELIEKIFLNDELTISEKSKQLRLGYLELFCEAMGNLAVVMMNAVFSDWKSVPELMNGYQALLSCAHLSDKTTEQHLSNLKLQSNLNAHISISDRCLIGAKMTGCGNGGDFIVLSLVSRDEHKHIIETTFREDVPIHFDSTQLTQLEWRQSVDGIRSER